MANNIGIKVDVAFPSAAELQAELERAWSTVNAEVEAKIKLGIDKTYLNGIKTQIRNALKEDIYEIQVGTKDALQDLGKMLEVIDKIDKELKQERKLKVNLDVVNLKSSLKDLLGSMEKVQRDSKNSLSQGMKGFNDEIKHADKLFTGLSRKMKLDREGNLTSVVTGQTKKDRLGASEKVTFRETSKGMTADVDYLYNKETALKNVKKATEDLFKIEKKMEAANTNGNVEQYGLYQKEYIEQQKNLRGLKKEYSDRYGESSNLSEDIKKLERQHQLERNNMNLLRRQNAEREEEEQRIKAINKEMSEYQSTINQAFGDYLKKIKEIDRINSALATATGAHKAELQNQLRVLTSQKDAIESQHDLMAVISDEQKKQLASEVLRLKHAQDLKNAKEIESQKSKLLQDATAKLVQLEGKRHEAIMKAKNATGEQKQALQDMIAHYSRIIQKVQQSVSYETQATQAQKDKMQAAKDIYKLQERLLSAKMKEEAYTQKEKHALMESKAVREDILRIQQRIKQLQGMEHKDGSHAELQSLKQALRIAQQQQQAINEKYQGEQRITNAIQAQNNMMNESHRLKMWQIAQDNKIRANQEKGNNLLRDYQQTLQRINSLQRDLVFAGDREQRIIERALSAERRKLEVMRQEVTASRHISEERKREIARIEEAQAEQLRLNRLRQEAREVDRVYDNAYGVTDFRSYMSEMTQGFRVMLDAVAQIDEAFMRVKKVAEATDETLQTFKNTSYDVASSLGVTATDYMSAVEKWVTAGYTLKESEHLGQISTIGSFVGNIDTDLMAKWLSVPLNTYKSSAIDANDIINVMNETANNHAIEMEELGKAYMRGAQSAKTAGVSFEELTGMIAGAQEATRMGGERIGTSMKTISSNYLQLKGAREGVFQDLTALNKKKEFEAFGIDIEGTESLTDLLSEVQKIWDTLEDTDQNRLLTALSGKEHLNVLTAIVNEWDDTVLKASSDADFQTSLVGDEKTLQGSAYKEFEEQKNSVRFQLAELKNSWLELMNTIGNSDGLVSDVLSALTNGLETLNGIVQNGELMDFLKMILLGVGMHAGANGVLRVFDLMATGANNVRNNLRDVYQLMRTNPFSNGSNGSNRNSGNSGNGDDDDNHPNGGNNNNNNNNNNSPNGGVVSNLGKAAKTVLGFLPLIGDALLIAELAGLDAFGAIGKGLDMIGGKSEKTVEDVERMMESFERGNMVLNGDLKILEHELNGGGGWRESLGNIGEGNTGLETESFKEMKEGFNNRVDELGFDSEIKIVWNDYDSIMAKINEYEKALEKLKAEEAKEVALEAPKMIEEYRGVQESNKAKKKEIEEEISELNAKRDTLLGAINKLEAEDDRSFLQNHNLEKYRSQLQETNTEIHNNEQAILDLAKANQLAEESIDGIGDSLLLVGTEEMAGLFEGLDLETAQILFDKIAESSKRAGENVNDLTGVSDALRSIGEETTVTASEFETMMSYIQKFGNKSLIDKALKLDLKDVRENANGARDGLADIFATLARANPDNAELQGLAQSVKRIGEESSFTKDDFNQMVAVISRIGDEQLLEELNSTSLSDLQNNVNGVRDRFIEVIGTTIETQQSLQQSGAAGMSMAQQIIGGLTQTQGSAQLTSQKILDIQNAIAGVDKSVVINLDAQVSQRLQIWWSKLQSQSLGMTNKAKKSGVSAVPMANNISTSTQGVVSANVSSANVASKANEGNSSVSNATSTKANTKTASSSSSGAEKVSQDIWRYWKIESEQSKLESVMQDLTRAVEDSTGNSKKLAELYKSQLSNLEKQRATQTSLKNAKTHEAQQRLGQLEAYGFKVNKKNLSISNLGAQSMKLTGDKATEAEELLNNWKSLVEEISGLEQSIKDVATEMKDIKIAEELNAYSKLIKQVEKHIATVENKEALNSTFLSLIDEKDVELNMQTLSKVAYDSASAVERLVTQFNNYAQGYVKYAENGEEFYSTMESLQGMILSSADALIENNKALNDMEIQRAIDDTDKFTSSIEQLDSRMASLRENVQEGLLSGTGIEDLEASRASLLDLGRDNKLDSMAQQRLSLEKDLQTVLEDYAKKNIERERSVSLEKLKINKAMYNELLDYENDFNEGKYIEQFKDVFAQFDVSTTDMNYSHNALLESVYKELAQKQDELNKKYSKELSSSVYEERLEAEYQYSIESLELQNIINKKRIEVAKKNVEEYNKQLGDSSLTKTQVESIKSQIEAEKDAIIDLQDAVKDNVATLYEFQLAQLEKIISKYDEMGEALKYSLDLVTTLKPQDLNAQYAVLESMKDNEVSRKAALRNSIASLKHEMSLLQQGSYEWNIINAQLQEYNGMLLDANSTILDMTNQIQGNQLNNIFGKFEKRLFDGKTSKQFKEYQDLWLVGLEREIALEELYQKISDMGTDAFDQKMSVLDKQEKVSRLEADYLSKQMEIYELQKGLEDAKEQRSVKTLQQNMDGTFQWNYVADEDSAESQNNAIKKAQLDLMKMEEDAKNSYLGKLQDIISRVQGNEFADKESLKEELKDMESAYGLILGDIPATMKKLQAEIVYAYEQSRLGNEDLLNELSQNGQSSPVVTTITNLKESLVSELKNLGDRVEGAIKTSLIKGSNYSEGIFKSNNIATSKGNELASGINIEKIEFPNATSSKEIQDALMNLPKYAMQYATSKR